MPTTKAKSALMGLVDSDLESDTDIISLAQPSTMGRPKAAAPKKGRGRPPQGANKVTKATQKPARRLSDRIAAAAAAAAASTDDGEEEPVRVLAENTTRLNARATKPRRKAVEQEDIEMSDVAASPAKAQPKAAANGNPTRGRPRAAASKTAGGRGAAQKTKAEAQPEAEREIPETQFPDAVDADMSEDMDQLEDLPRSNLPTRLAPQPSSGTVPSSVRSQRFGNTDHSDASLRRRLGEMTRKYENLEHKYRDLRELGVKEAERNFDRLKKQADERAQASKQLVSDLKTELAARTESAKEGQKLQKRLEERDSMIESLQYKITELTDSLVNARSEIKTLTTKLAASRSAEAGMPKVPGSAMKNGAMGSRNIVTNEAVLAAQMKEDLYGDLTGLMIRSLKREDGEDVFDCLQTGGNGTLHFKLSVENEIESDTYEETQVVYRPQLDARRDAALIESLPDYLVEEITFPRPHSAKFYSRVCKALNERMM